MNYEPIKRDYYVIDKRNPKDYLIVNRVAFHAIQELECNVLKEEYIYRRYPEFFTNYDSYWRIKNPDFTNKIGAIKRFLEIFDNERDFLFRKKILEKQYALKSRN